MYPLGLIYDIRVCSNRTWLSSSNLHSKQRELILRRRNKRCTKPGAEEILNFVLLAALEGRHMPVESSARGPHPLPPWLTLQPTLCPAGSPHLSAPSTSRPWVPAPEPSQCQAIPHQPPKYPLLCLGQLKVWCPSTDKQGSCRETDTGQALGQGYSALCWRTETTDHKDRCVLNTHVQGYTVTEASGKLLRNLSP